MWRLIRWHNRKNESLYASHSNPESFRTRHDVVVPTPASCLLVKSVVYSDLILFMWQSWVSLSPEKCVYDSAWGIVSSLGTRHGFALSIALAVVGLTSLDTFESWLIESTKFAPATAYLEMTMPPTTSQRHFGNKPTPSPRGVDTHPRITQPPPGSTSTVKPTPNDSPRTATLSG